MIIRYPNHVFLGFDIVKRKGRFISLQKFMRHLRFYWMLKICFSEISLIIHLLKLKFRKKSNKNFEKMYIPLIKLSVKKYTGMAARCPPGM